MNNEKIIVGKKENQNTGLIFYPYLTVLKLRLPLMLVGIDKDKGPIFTKIEIK